MNPLFKSALLASTGAESFRENQIIQSLWSGYGSIKRYHLSGSIYKSVVVKHVQLPTEGNHPRGWNTNISHLRKVKSYEIECAWYDQWNQRCDNNCRTPKCLSLTEADGEVFMVLEDLDEAGFSERLTSVIDAQLFACLTWLANFHASFLAEKPAGLWPVGTYWHLETRPDELAALDDLPLKKAAPLIDKALNQSPFQTFVHGDAKLANFCFSQDGKSVAAVDFQYVGGGCGMKDVVYFLGSCLSEKACEKREAELLNFYFDELKKALASKKKNVDAVALEKNWRDLYPVAWADFHRFLKGWSPDHWKINGYSERITKKTIQKLTLR